MTEVTSAASSSCSTLPYIVVARQRITDHRATFTPTTPCIGRPFVTLTWAQSLDGSITAARGKRWHATCTYFCFPLSLLS
jgi:hypothetical protein